MRETRTIKPQLALEMTMRDVLGNMEEMLGGFAFGDMGGEFEIIAIEPTAHNTEQQQASCAPRIRDMFCAELHQLPRRASQVA